MLVGFLKVIVIEKSMRIFTENHVQEANVRGLWKPYRIIVWGISMGINLKKNCLRGNTKDLIITCVCAAAEIFYLCFD